MLDKFESWLFVVDLELSSTLPLLIYIYYKFVVALCVASHS